MVDILSVLESPGTATVTEEITSDVFYERLENTGLDEQAPTRRNEAPVQIQELFRTRITAC